MGGVRVVKAFAQEERQLRRFNGAVARVFDQSMVSTRLRAFYAPSDRLPAPARAGRPALRGRPPGDQRVARRRRLRGLLRLRADAHLADAHAGHGARDGPARGGLRGARVRAARPRAAAHLPPGARAAAAGGGRVELRDVTFGYDGGEPVLRDVSLEVEPGKTVALVGPTGSGKTTLVMLVPRLYDVQEGAVLVDGVDVRDVDPAALRREVAVVSDDAFLFSATLRENIAYARPDATEEEVRAGRGAGRARRADRRPPRRLRHPGGRARPHPLRRPAPARGHRPRAAGRAAHPDPRRRHLQRGRHHREPHQGRARRGHGGAHHLRDRPPALHHRPGRRGRGARGRRDRGARHPRRAAGGPRRSTGRSPRRACPTRCSSPATTPSARWRACEATLDDPPRRGAPHAQAAAPRDAAAAPTGAGAPHARSRCWWPPPPRSCPRTSPAGRGRRIIQTGRRTAHRHPDRVRGAALVNWGATYARPT